MWNLLLPTIGPIIDKLVGLIPNSNDRAKAKEEFERTLMEAVNQAAHDQTEINKIEAASSSLFVAGWRPFIGWVCGFALAYVYIIYPLLLWASAAYSLPFNDLPKLETDALYQLVLAMLGLGGLRTFERIKGVIPAGK
jgi:hypothetical protein